MSEGKQVIINGITYRIKEWLAVERDVFLFEMNDLFGAWLPNIIEHFFKDTVDFQEIAASGLIQSILQRGNASPQQKAEFIKRLIISSVITPKDAGTDEGYNLHWSKHYAHRLELIKEIFALNFGDMIQELKKKLQGCEIFTPQSSSEPEITPDLSEKPKRSFPKPNFSNGR